MLLCSFWSEDPTVVHARLLFVFVRESSVLGRTPSLKRRHQDYGIPTDRVEAEIAAFVLYAQNQRCPSAQEIHEAVGDHVAILVRFYQLVHRRMVTLMELEASDVRASMRLSPVYVTLVKLSDQVTFPSISFDFKILYFASNPLMNHVNVV